MPILSSFAFTFCNRITQDRNWKCWNENGGVVRSLGFETRNNNNKNSV